MKYETFPLVTEETDVKKIKTPDQVPDRVNYQGVPEHVLRSDVIDSLINQNDDLMSRLTVALRRVATLEEKISDTQNSSVQYKAKYENLKDQLLIIKEQSRIVSQRSMAAEEKLKRDDELVNDLKEQIQILEIRYAELYASAQQKQSALESRLNNRDEAANRHSRRIEKYRHNLARAAKSIKKELFELRIKDQNHESILRDLRKNISESTTYISEQAKNHKHDLQSLTENYESQIQAMRVELNKLQEKNDSLFARANEYDHLHAEKVKIENELIIASRKSEQLELQFAAESSDMQKSLIRYRNEAKSLATEIAGIQVELESTKHTAEELGEEKHKLTEQVETLQLLWRDQQGELEKANDQKASLQKLNQELSITINEYRREIRDLKARLDASELKAIQYKAESERKEEAVKEIKASHMQELKVKDEKIDNLSSQSSTDGQASQQKLEIKREDMVTPEILTKIDKVLSDLHIGH